MTEFALLFLHALTGLHPGSGAALGVVDLPVQRERHTGFPTIPGTSLKGVIRAEARNKPEEECFAVFGPDTKNAADHAGAVAFTDARILAFPVRSLKGVFAWVTCPAVLQRLVRDLDLAHAKPFPCVPHLTGDDARVCKNTPLEIIDAGEPGLVFEEFDFKAAPGADDIAAWIADHAVSDTETATRIRSHFAVIPDDAFKHFVQHATEVTARIALDAETKTVREHALFYEEFLPPETLFHGLLIAESVRRKKNDDGNGMTTAAQVLDWIRALDLKTIQIGGGETIGKGLCALNLHRQGGATP
ncbi:MAG: type III-B CRISPR module RAMP protein Cmr4 [Acetobacteraceae bacterium]